MPRRVILNSYNSLWSHSLVGTAAVSLSFPCSQVPGEKMEGLLMCLEGVS